MSKTGERAEIVRSKGEGMKHFQKMGYRVIAFLDDPKPHEWLL